MDYFDAWPTCLYYWFDDQHWTVLSKHVHDFFKGFVDDNIDYNEKLMPLVFYVNNNF